MPSRRWLKQKKRGLRKAVQEDRREDRISDIAKRIEQRRCFWIWPWGHVYTDKGSVRACSACLVCGHYRSSGTGGL